MNSNRRFGETSDCFELQLLLRGTARTTFASAFAQALLADVTWFAAGFEVVEKRKATARRMESGQQLTGALSVGVGA